MSDKYCEFCGIKGHVTKRSGKCTAKDSLIKRFNKEDGSLLTLGPPLGVLVEPEHLNAAANLSRHDCSHMDLLPFDANYDSQEEQPAPFFDEDDASDDDHDSV
jgi:hypothetical protein